MKDEIRMAVSLPGELENEVFELSDLSCELLEEGKVEEALEKIELAWAKLPEPRFNTSVSHLILCALIPILNTAGQYKEALALIPEPQNSYSEAFWLETSIGDCYFMLNNFGQSLVHFLNAKGNIETNGHENPFVMLRLGELFLEGDHFNDAKEFLLRAYMLEGKEIFETEHGKYFVFLEQNVELNKPG